MFKWFFTDGNQTQPDNVSLTAYGNKMCSGNDSSNSFTATNKLTFKPGSLCGERHNENEDVGSVAIGQGQPSLFYPPPPPSACGFDQTMQTNQLHLSGQYEKSLLSSNPIKQTANDCYGFYAMNPNNVDVGMINAARCNRFTVTGRPAGHLYDVPHRSCPASMKPINKETTCHSHYNLPQQLPATFTNQFWMQLPNHCSFFWG